MIKPWVLQLPEVHQRVMQYIFHHGQATRQELSDDLGKSLMTISKAVTALIEEDMVMVDGALSAAAGRRKSILKLNPCHRLCVCVDIGYSSIKLALVAMNGDVMEKSRLPGLPYPIKSGIPEEAMLDVIESMIDRAGRERVLGIAVGISGMVNFEEGHVLFCPNIKGFNDRPLAAELSEKFSLPVLLDTSARCMALGEHCFGAGRGARDQMMLSLGAGSIASGIVSDGQLYRGAQGYAGEIGHTCVRPGARLQRCTCGGYDCLELYATGEMIREEIDASLREYDGYSKAKILLDGEPLTMNKLHPLWHSGDPIVHETIEAAVEDISSVLTGAVNLLTPSLVILGGGVVWHLPEVVEMIESRVRTSCLAPLREDMRFVRSALGEDAALQGAAVLLILKYLGEI